LDKRLQKAVESLPKDNQRINEDYFVGFHCFKAKVQHRQFMRFVRAFSQTARLSSLPSPIMLVVPFGTFWITAGGLSPA